MVLKGSLQKERSVWMWKSKPCDFIPSQRIRLRSPKKLRKQSLCLTAIAEWPHPFPFRTGRWNALAPMIVGCISGESRSLSGSPFKTLESFSFEGFVLCAFGKPGERKEELTLLLFPGAPKYSPGIKNCGRIERTLREKAARPWIFCRLGIMRRREKTESV